MDSTSKDLQETKEYTLVFEDVPVLLLAPFFHPALYLDRDAACTINAIT